MAIFEIFGRQNLIKTHHLKKKFSRGGGGGQALKQSFATCKFPYLKKIIIAPSPSQILGTPLVGIPIFFLFFNLIRSVGEGGGQNVCPHAFNFGATYIVRWGLS